MQAIRSAWVPIFLVACAVFVWSYADTLYEHLRALRPVAPGWLLLALLLQASVWFALAAGWREVVHSRTGIRYPVRNALIHLAFFSLGKYLPGKVWGAAARALNMGREGVSGTDSLEATLHEQFLVLHSAGIVSLVLLPLVHPGWVPWLAAAMAVASAPIGGRLVHASLPWLTRLLKQDSKPLHRLPMGRAAALVGQYALAWLLHGAVLVTIYASLFGGLSAIDGPMFGLLVLGNTVGMVAGFAAVFAPAGLGVREAMITAVLAQGMPLPEAAALSIAMRLWTVATDAGFGGLALLARPRAAG